jgi:LytS/YehU family sensor histidine kinase
VSEAVEAAKDQINQIVQEQVDRKLAKFRHSPPRAAYGWPDLSELAVVLLFALTIVKIALGSKRRAESRAQEADAAAAEEGLRRQLAEAQLKTMQAQVEPHFLFNTLASVDYLIETDPARASRMQKNLIQYLRSSLPQMRQGSSTLSQELALCRSYLEILKVRMDERLQFAITLPAGLSTAAFPPMMLQTLVENSIKHGLEPKPEGGALTLSADVVNGNLRVAVSDTGLGFGATGSSGGGVGLNNVRERLRALFGGRARLTIEPNSPTGTIATIEVPYTIGVKEPTPSADPGPSPTSPQPA